jgi:hypothetical protein
MWFPPSVPTHSREQVFYFNQAGLLQRLDYTPSISGREAAPSSTIDLSMA